MNPDALKVDGESAGCLCTIKWPPLPDVSERTLYLLWPLLGRPGAFLAALPVALQVEVASLSTAEPPSLGRGIGACCGRGRHWGGHSRWLRHAGHGGPGDRIGPGGGFRAESGAGPYLPDGPGGIGWSWRGSGQAGCQAQAGHHGPACKVNQLASVLPGLVEQVRLVSERQTAHRALTAPWPGSPAKLP